MKKILLLLSLVFITSCSSETEDQETKITDDYPSVHIISPPNWIMGTWTSSEGNKFEFKKSDVQWNYLDETSSARKAILYYEIQDEDPEFNQTQTDNSYNLEYKDSPSAKRKLKFIKISETQIESTEFRKGIYTKK